MEEAGVARGLWEGEAKAVQQCLTDIFTSVYTTCDIPENAIFGPCVLSHTSLYDSIAFIALKSTDKRTVPYIFRVDTSAANGSSEGLMWLRLVQSARDKEEQNLEAYIKNGQLFYRSLRRVAKDEELLVWYGKELSELLLLGPARTQSKMNGSAPFSCLECSQRFQFEFPFVAHLRFRCTKRLQGAESGSPAVEEESRPKAGSPKDPLGPGGAGKPPAGKPPSVPPPGPRHRFHGGSPDSAPSKPSTDFHNLARELENFRSGGERGGGGSKEAVAEVVSKASKRKYPPEERLERPVPSSPQEELVCTPQPQFRPAGSYFGLDESSRLFGPPSPETGEAKRSAFVEVKKASRGREGSGGGEEEAERSSPGGAREEKGQQPPQPQQQQPHLLGTRSGGSAFSTVPPSSQSSSEERKSAFSQPARSSFASSSSSSHVKMVEAGGGHADGAARLYAPEPLAVKLQSATAEMNSSGGDRGGGGGGGGGGLPKQSPFLYAAATTFWPKSSTAALAAAAAAAAGPLQLQIPSALTLLPPSFTSLCLPAQNWCAKCNASFRMTSDLVYHMRSHHKKEYALEPLVKRRREEKLKCPICNESFRERHHLSRHMTSHN
ncbi:PR domain zinc finger protein 8 [Anolis carolinensis]|uniref:PR domain zinc finger protein 8 n=1 Tax=Anolis carolinensis TaxID=28377 RepID=UPI002F2B683D